MIRITLRTYRMQLYTSQIHKIRHVRKRAFLPISFLNLRRLAIILLLPVISKVSLYTDFSSSIKIRRHAHLQTTWLTPRYTRLDSDAPIPVEPDAFASLVSGEVTWWTWYRVAFIVFPGYGFAVDGAYIILEDEFNALVRDEAFSQREFEFCNMFTLDFDLREDATTPGIPDGVADVVAVGMVW
jgi:hypothetical protein